MHLCLGYSMANSYPLSMLDKVCLPLGYHSRRTFNMHAYTVQCSMLGMLMTKTMHSVVVFWIGYGNNQGRLYLFGMLAKV